MVDVLNQTTTMMTRRNSEAQLATLQPQDVLIQPPLAAWLYRLRPRRAAGRCRLSCDARAARTTGRNAHDDWRQSGIEPRALRRPAHTGHNRNPGGKRLQGRRCGDPAAYPPAAGRAVGPGAPAKDMGTLYGLDYFERVEYRVQRGKLGNTLVINAREKRSGTDYLRLGLSLSDDFQGDSVFNLGASYRKNGINQLGAEWLTRLQLGIARSSIASSTSRWTPVRAGSPHRTCSSRRRTSRPFSTTTRSPNTACSATATVSISAGRSPITARSASVSARPGEADVRIGERDLPDFSFTEGYYECSTRSIRWTISTFPRGRGYPSDPASVRPEPQLRPALSTVEHQAGQGAQPWCQHLGTGRSLRSHPGRRRGGHLELPARRAPAIGLSSDALSGQNVSLGRVVYYRRVTPRAFQPLDFPLYLGGSLERGLEQRQRLRQRLHQRREHLPRLRHAAGPIELRLRHQRRGRAGALHESGTQLLALVQIGEDARVHLLALAQVLFVDPGKGLLADLRRNRLDFSRSAAAPEPRGKCAWHGDPRPMPCGVPAPAPRGCRAGVPAWGLPPRRFAPARAGWARDRNGQVQKHQPACLRQAQIGQAPIQFRAPATRELRQLHGEAMLLGVHVRPFLQN